MERVYENIMALSKASICKQAAQIDNDLDGKMVLDIVRHGKMSGVLVNQLIEHGEQLGVDAGELQQFRQQIFVSGIQQMVKVRHLGNVLADAENCGLKPIVFKGIVIADLYPEPYMRFSSDADIYIDEQDTAKMQELLLNSGFVFQPNSSKPHVPVFVDYTDGLKIELHDRLWEDYEGTQVERLEQIGFTQPEHIIRQEVLGYNIYTIRPEEHFVYQIFHMAKHLAMEGLPLRYLVDTTLFVQKYAGDIEWKHFWNTMKYLKYDTFASVIITICSEYLGLNAEALNMPRVADYLVEELLEDIMNYGTCKEDVGESFATTGFVTQYFMRDHVQTNNKMKRMRMVFFPLPKELKKKYKYANKCPILLPIAWIHRFFSAINYSIICRRKGMSAVKVFEKAGHRIELIASLKIIDEID